MNRIMKKGGIFMGYSGYSDNNCGNYNNGCYNQNSGSGSGSGSGFVLIVVLFILLIIVGATFMTSSY